MYGRLIRGAIVTAVICLVLGEPRHAVAEDKPAGGVQVKVFPVQKGDAVARVQMLQALFGPGTSATRPLRLAADRRTNTIIAVGNPTDLELIRGLLARLDQ
jgi:type II secretory pathway component GspD/PulD (secretin)